MISVSPNGRLRFEHDGHSGRVVHDRHGRSVPIDGVLAAAAFDDQVWLLRSGCEVVLCRVDDWGLALDQQLILSGATGLRPAPFGAPSAIVTGAQTLEVRDDFGRLCASELPDDSSLVIPVSPRRWVRVRDGVLLARRGGREERLHLRDDLGLEGVPCDGAAVFGGHVVALVLEEGSQHLLALIDLRARVVRQRVRVDDFRALRVAQAAAQVAVQCGDRDVVVLDLRFGTVLWSGSEARGIRDLAIDARGKVLLLQRPDENGGLEVVEKLSQGLTSCHLG